MVSEESMEAKKRVKYESLRSLFMHADRVDMWLLALGLIGAVFDGLTGQFRFIFASNIVNVIGSASKLDPDVFRHNLNKNALALLYVAVVSFVACFLEGYCWTRTGARQASKIRAKYLKAILRQDLGYFDLHATTTTSEVITSISSHSLIIQDAISEKIPDFVSKISKFIGGYVVAFILVWQLAMAALPSALLLVIPSWFCGRSLIDLSGKIMKEYNKAGAVAEQAISSIRTVYAFIGEKKTVAKFSASLNGSMNLGLRQGLVKGFAIGSNATVFALWSVMSYYGSRLVMYHGIQGGTIFSAGLAIIQGGQALGAGLSNIKDIAEACSAGRHIMEVINRIPKIDSEDMKGIILENVSGEVEFKQVKFSYPSRPEIVALQNFSLTIPARKTVALVGASGSGKSTALSLLQRFYDPLEGEILLDGIAIDKLQLKWLRSQMALVSQEPSLFSTSIKENILFGKEDATMEDILEASKACDAHNFISQLPQGYDTQVGERGVQLSGGQKQRVAIARAIIRRPQILLLDEATSALDSESERFVQEAIDKVAMGRTTMIIAHRLSTIKNADTIAVVENGQVKEIGSHDVLIKEENSSYYSFISLQQMKKEKNLEECTYLPSSPSKKDLDKDVSKQNPIIISSRELTSTTSQNRFTNDCLEDTNSSTTPTPSFLRLFGLNKPEWKQASLGCLSAILSGAIQPLFAVTKGATLSLYFSTDQHEIKERIRILALCFFGLSIFSFMISISQHYSFAYVGENLTRRIRERMLSKILTFEVGWYDKEKNSSSVICSRLSKDANVVRSLVGDKISLLIQALSAIIVSWTMGLVLSWRLAIVLIVVQPLIVACFYTKSVLLKNMSKRAMKAQDESTKLAAEAVSNLRTVTAFSSQDRILIMLEKTQQAPRKESIRQSWFAGIALACSLSIQICNWCLGYWYSGELVSKGHVSPRAVFQTIIVLVTTCYVIAEVGNLISILFKGWDTIQSVFAMLDRNTRIEPESPEGYKPEKVTGHIELCDVHFAYPSRPNIIIFEGFSLNIGSGKSMALVGKSGSGKSTVIGLIERFYAPIKGVVKIDGRDLKSFHLRSLRKYIALVNQEPTLFGGTIRENITYGSSDNVTESEIIEAARAAKVHDFIMRQNDGYETLCGHRGLQLSGGQKQRIAIARAILKSPTILLLDEATSALDSHSEKMVQIALERLMMGRTSVVVAHRLSTIQNCDQIAVMDKGEVVEKGTHPTLMAKGPIGAYYSLVCLQSTEKSEIGSPQ